MGAATEGVDARPRACVGPLEAPAALKVEGFRTPKDKRDDRLRIAGHVITDPEHGTTVLRLDGDEKSVRRWVFLRVLLHQRIVEVEGARRVVGCADIEHA